MVKEQQQTPSPSDLEWLALPLHSQSVVKKRAVLTVNPNACLLLPQQAHQEQCKTCGGSQICQLTAAGARSAWGRASAPTSARRASVKSAADRRYVSTTDLGESVRSVWGRESAPTSAARFNAGSAADRTCASIIAKRGIASCAWVPASALTSAARVDARTASDRRSASMTAAGASARSAWGRASAPTSATIVDARAVNAVPHTPVPQMQVGLHQASSRAWQREAGNPREARVARRPCKNPTLPLTTSKMILTMRAWMTATGRSTKSTQSSLPKTGKRRRRRSIPQP